MDGNRDNSANSVKLDWDQTGLGNKKNGENRENIEKYGKKVKMDLYRNKEKICKLKNLENQ